MRNRELSFEGVIGVFEEEDMAKMSPQELEKNLNPKEIWLEPWCRECEANYIGEGRMWSVDDFGGRCDDKTCKRKSVKYVRVGLG